jgi:hypothetical protein
MGILGSFCPLNPAPSFTFWVELLWELPRKCSTAACWKNWPVWAWPLLPPPTPPISITRNWLLKQRKLQILSCLAVPSLGSQRRGNIFLAYSNAGLDRALPLLRLLAQAWPQQQLADLWRMWMGSSSPPVNLWLEFEPSPTETNRLIEEQYPVRHNLLVEFRQDDIDDIPLLYQQLCRKYQGHTEWQDLEGDHLTPLGFSYPFQVGEEFSPIDAFGQLLYQNLLAPNHQMIRSIQAWLATQLA